MACDEHGTRRQPDKTWHDHLLFAQNSLYSAGDAYHGDHPGCLDHPRDTVVHLTRQPERGSVLAAVWRSQAPLHSAPVTSSRDVQRWTVHFGMSDVFQRFLGHLEPLNQNPSDATLAPLSILQNSRWRPRWPPSEWKLLKWPYFLCHCTQKCTSCVYLYVLPPREYDEMGFNRFR